MFEVQIPLIDFMIMVGAVLWCGIIQLNKFENVRHLSPRSTLGNGPNYIPFRSATEG